MKTDFCGVEKWSSRLAHNQEIEGSNPSQRNQIQRRPAGQGKMMKDIVALHIITNVS